MAATIDFPHPGISTWKIPGARVVRLSHEADPAKGMGEKIEVDFDGKKMLMSPWLYQQYTDMSDKNLFRQEILIDFEARQGQRLFSLDESATLVTWKQFELVKKADGTIWYGLDPHPRVPHAHLWCWVDRYGDRWYYREFWPSKIYGQKGNIPEDDSRYKIKEYCQAVQWLESADNPENFGKAEHVYRRVIDYAARAMGQGTVDDEPQLNFQQRYEKVSREIGSKEHGDGSGWRMAFVDCVKDRDAGIELVNEGLKPLKVEVDGEWKRQSRIHIVADKCPELILQLRDNRYPQLTALQAERQDPIATPMQKRNHQTDLIRYIEMDKPRFIQHGKVKSDWKPLHRGVNF